MTGIDDFSAVMDIYEETNPEIVIMDVQLPKYDGFYWCRKISKHLMSPSYSYHHVIIQWTKS